MDRVWDWLIRAQKLWWPQTAKAQDSWRTQGLHVAPQHNPTTKGKSESHSVVYNSLWLHGLYSPWNSLGQSTRVGSLSLLQGIFPTQGLNPGRWILYQLSQQGSPRILEWVAYPFSSQSAWPRNRTHVSCIAGGLLSAELPQISFTKIKENINYHY